MGCAKEEPNQLFFCVSFLCLLQCQVFIRWPVRGDKNEHPYLSEANVLEHNHTVEKANRRLLYAEMLKKITAAVNSGVQTVPAETLRAIVEAFERNIHAAAMTSSG